jgi:hypothetical protein
MRGRVLNAPPHDHRLNCAGACVPARDERVGGLARAHRRRGARHPRRAALVRRLYLELRSANFHHHWRLARARGSWFT